MANIEKVNEACSKLLQAFETGQIPPAVARTFLQEQVMDLPSNKWSLGNKMLMLLAGTTDARGYRQWEEVGRHVKKGAKAFYILAPVTKMKVVVEEDAEGNKVKKERPILVGFTAVPVFRYEDTEGKEIQLPNYDPPSLPPLVEVAAKFNIRVTYGPMTQRFYGCYTPSNNSILLCTHDVEVFFHELAHAVHNTFRPLKGGQHADQEIVADTVAAVLCQMYGYEGYLYHSYEYIKGYARADNPTAVVKAIMKVLADVQRVLEIILAHAEDATCQVA